MQALKHTGDFYGFQSTLPARGSDLSCSILCFIVSISIHAPRKGERHVSLDTLTSSQTNFNPRSPQGGATQAQVNAMMANEKFQSTLPARGSDIYGISSTQTIYISIHAPRKGERRLPLNIGICLGGISIHAPRKGERLIHNHHVFHALAISIHAPRKGERHSNGVSTISDAAHFNPRSPQGGATWHLLRR